MTDRKQIEHLGALFVSVTGHESVVESQARDSPTREIPVEQAATTDSSVYHGLEDAIDNPDVAASGLE